ncbi:MAG TPA: alkaline phosphatase family protein [Thermoanaerobaculia bacterium]|nr:alkaline phosphatase family protein [Thermoanaerobaculia bacterium]
MKRTTPLLFLLFLGCTTTFPHVAQTEAATFPGRQFEHVLIIVLENEDNETVLANTYMKKIADGGRRFADYDGLFHPSYPNYLALVAGDFFHTKGDQQKTIDARTIADLLEAHHLTWTQYAQNYPGHCFLGAKTPDGLYTRKHVPFLSFKSIQAPDRCKNVVSADQFDRHNLPNYAFFTPNMKNDGHDTSLAFAAKWLAGFLAPILADPSVMKDTLVVVTFDESATQSHNHIYTVFLGGMVEPGVDTKHYDHYNLLRTIEDNFGVGTLGAKDATSIPIVDAWKNAP